MNGAITATKSKTLSISAKMLLRLLVIFFWTQHTIFVFVVQIIKRLPIIGSFAPFFMPALFTATVAFCLPYMLSKIRPADFIFYMACLLVVFSTMIIYPSSGEYIEPQLWRIFLTSVPLYFLGVLYSHEDSKKDLFWCSAIGTLLMFLYQLYVLNSGRVLSSDNMDSSYKVLPSIMYLIYWAFETKKLKYSLIAFAGAMTSFVFGTRGPILAIFIFLAIGIFMQIVNLKKSIVKILYIFLCALVLFYFLSGDRLLEISKFLSQLFGKIGFSTRIFDFLIENKITYDSGRSILRDTVFAAINDKPFLGYGFMGDRAVIGFYVHNIFFEIWCSYGLIFGSVLIALIAAIPLRALWISRKSNYFYVILMLLCMVFSKLTVTGSYTSEPYLFLLIGMSIGEIRRKSHIAKGEISNENCSN